MSGLADLRCPSFIPWESHRIELRERPPLEKPTWDLYLSFTVGGFWVCGHFFDHREDDEGDP